MATISAREPLKGVSKIRHRLLELESDPLPHDVKLLKGSARDYRIDSGECRILHDIDHDSRVITVWRIGHRKDVYRNL